MSKTNNVKVEKNLIRRYPPNTRFNFGAFINQPTINQTVTYKGESITDKESYRLNLASSRGAISSLSEKQNKGWYMFEDGKYDPHKDFSYIMRKDLSIVEIDEYTERLKSELQTADKKLKADIESQIKALNDKKTELEKVEVSKEGDYTTSNE